MARVKMTPPTIAVMRVRLSMSSHPAPWMNHLAHARSAATSSAFTMSAMRSSCSLISPSGRKKRPRALGGFGSSGTGGLGRAGASVTWVTSLLLRSGRGLRCGLGLLRFEDLLEAREACARVLFHAFSDLVAEEFRHAVGLAFDGERDLGSLGDRFVRHGAF